MDLENYCLICSDLFDEDSKLQITLSCNHSFCRACLVKIFDKSPFCPTCKKDIQLSDIELIHPDLSIDQLVGMKSDDEENCVDMTENETNHSCPQSKKFLAEGICEVHENANELRCMNCEVWICSMCAILNHKEHRTLLVEEAFDEMKKGCREKVEKEVTAQKRKCDVIDDKLLNVNEKRERLKKELETCEARAEKLLRDKSEAQEILGKLENLERSVNESVSCKEVTDTLNIFNTLVEQANQVEDEAVSDVSLQDLKNYNENGTVCVVSHSGSMPQYGKAVFENDEVWVSGFRKKAPSSKKLVTLEEVSALRSLHIRQDPYTQRAYLKISASNKQFSVVIRTDDLGPRALNFLYLCSGMKGISYRGIYLQIYAQGYYTPEHQLRDSAVIAKMPASKSCPVKTGNVGGMNEYKAWFYIEMKDHPTSTVPNKFGEVEIGLDLLETAWQEKQNLKIVECGLVF